MDPTQEIKTAETVPLTQEQIVAAIMANQPTNEELAAAQDTIARMREARLAPLPGPLREAFAAAPRVLLGRTLVPISANHIRCLVQIDSPFLTSMQLGQLLVQTENEDERKRILARAELCKTEIIDAVKVLILFSSAGDLAIDALSEPEGPARLHAGATALLNDLPPLCDWEEVIGALGAHYAASLITAVALQRREKPGDTKQLFPGRARPKTGTASDGCLTW
jgi:hypothetical protein